ncbi:MAG: hypothetical protein NZ746_01475 [Blastocatellia bacterium]|nr:hypothetical protein [Blastocatellia bacterium]
MSPRQDAREEVLRFSGFYPILNKRVRFDWDRPSEILVRVEGLKLDDLFAVRSRGDELSISTGYASGHLADPFHHEKLDIHPLPSSGVRVEKTIVEVRCPAEIEGIAFFEVQVPKGVRIHLSGKLSSRQEEVDDLVAFRWIVRISGARCARLTGNRHRCRLRHRRVSCRMCR